MFVVQWQTNRANKSAGGSGKTSAHRCLPHTDYMAFLLLTRNVCNQGCNCARNDNLLYIYLAFPSHSAGIMAGKEKQRSQNRACTVMGTGVRKVTITIHVLPSMSHPPCLDEQAGKRSFKAPNLLPSPQKGLFPQLQAYVIHTMYGQETSVMQEVTAMSVTGCLALSCLTAGHRRLN